MDTDASQASICLSSETKKAKDHHWEPEIVVRQNSFRQSSKWLLNEEEAKAEGKKHTVTWKDSNYVEMTPEPSCSSLVYL